MAIWWRKSQKIHMLNNIIVIEPPLLRMGVLEIYQGNILKGINQNSL